MARRVPKYVAAGFMDDAVRLFADFGECPNKDFPTFCEIWKKQQFYCIFMGRPEEKEFKDFVHEIYNNLLDFITLSSKESNICAIYLLYALYKNQDILPSIKIRVTLKQYQVFKQMLLYAVEKKLHHLHFIIQYLEKNCMDFVYHSSLFGPCCSKNRSYIEPKLKDCGAMADLKQDMTLFHNSRGMQDLKSMHMRYLTLKDVLQPEKNRVKEDIGKKYDDFQSALDMLVHDRYTKVEKEYSDDIGNRRLYLKNAAFQRKAAFRLGNPDVHEEESEVPANKTDHVILKRTNKKKTPVSERRIGRPKKHNPEISSAKSPESEESDEIKPVFISPPPVTKRGRIGRRKVSYLKDPDGPVLDGIKKKQNCNDLSESSDESVEELTF